MEAVWMVCNWNICREIVDGEVWWVGQTIEPFSDPFQLSIRIFLGRCSKG